ncbi:tripartite motif-containing protein 45-like [Mizuhopecten yessoensis]|uniref:tripartite motif-containing protein 45-like n=1 Tax=Mizuhopecten yessoensis TaxID=6573 RepID=UPI000B45DEE1|nr:tripartite motif-containing protein 45-like [Mizuhopecten yessoensis]
MAENYVDEVEKITKLKSEFLECSICMEEYDEAERKPRLLPCLHTFCNFCLLQIYKNDIVSCSICKTEHQIANLESVPVDRTRWDLLDFVRAVTSVSTVECEVCDKHEIASHRCQECSRFFCKNCIEAHYTMQKVIGKHTVFDLQQKPGKTDSISRYVHQQYCELHTEEKLLYYCSGKNCETPICNSCYVLNHSDKEDHTVKAITDVYDTEKAQLLELSRSVQNKVDEATLIAQNVDLTIHTLLKNEKQSEEEVDAAFNICAELLERRRQDQRVLIKEKSEQKRKVLTEQAESLSSSIDCMRTDCKFLEQSLSSENPAGFLIIAPTIRNKFHVMLNQETEHIPFQTAHMEYIKQNMATNFSSFVQTLGSVATSSLFPPNTIINVQDSDPEVNKRTDIHVQLFDHDKNLLVDDNVDILVRIKPPNGNALDTHCVKTNDGQYKAAWTPTTEGQHLVQGFAFEGNVELPGKNINVKKVTKEALAEGRPEQTDTGRKTPPPRAKKTGRIETSTERRPGTKETGRKTSPPARETDGMEYLTMHMDEDTLYKACYLSEDRITLFNTRHPPPPDGQLDGQLYSHDWPAGGHALQKYSGVKGSRSVSPPDNVYYEVDVHFKIIKDLTGTQLVFEVGLAWEKEIDSSHYVGHTKHGKSVYLLRTGNSDRDTMTLACWNNKQKIFTRDTHSSKAGTTADIRIGVNINTLSKTISFLDVVNNTLLTKIGDVDTSQPLWPVFGVYNPHLVDVRVTLR